MRDEGDDLEAPPLEFPFTSPGDSGTARPLCLHPTLCFVSCRQTRLATSYPMLLTDFGRGGGCGAPILQRRCACRTRAWASLTPGVMLWHGGLGALGVLPTLLAFMPARKCFSSDSAARRTTAINTPIAPTTPSAYCRCPRLQSRAPQPRAPGVPTRTLQDDDTRHRRTRGLGAQHPAL
jgi:hypothetical protein